MSQYKQEIKWPVQSRLKEKIEILKFSLRMNTIFSKNANIEGDIYVVKGYLKSNIIK